MLVVLFSTKSSAQFYGGGNLDYLLDPRYAMMQVQQQMPVPSSQFQFSPQIPQVQFDFSNTPISVDPASAPSTSSSTPSSSSSNGHSCRLCKGTGRKIQETYLGNASQSKWCNECSKEVYAGHKHVICDLCGGDGWVD